MRLRPSDSHISLTETRAIYGRNFQPAQLPATQLTHVNYAFANLRSDGTVLVTLSSRLTMEKLELIEYSGISLTPTPTWTNTIPTIRGMRLGTTSMAASSKSTFLRKQTVT